MKSSPLNYLFLRPYSANPGNVKSAELSVLCIVPAGGGKAWEQSPVIPRLEETQGAPCLSYPALPRAVTSEQLQRLAAFLREFVSLYFNKNTTTKKKKSLKPVYPPCWWQYIKARGTSVSSNEHTQQSINALRGAGTSVKPCH